MVLSQMLFWHGTGKLADGWIYKSYAEWEEETGLSEYQVRRVMTWMRAWGFLETRVREVNRVRVHQFRLNIEKLIQWIERATDYKPDHLLTPEGKRLRQERAEAELLRHRVYKNQRHIEEYLKVIDAATELPERPRRWLESRKDSIKSRYSFDPAGLESFTEDDIAAVQRFAASLPPELRSRLEHLIPAAKTLPQEGAVSEG